MNSVAILNKRLEGYDVMDQDSHKILMTVYSQDLLGPIQKTLSKIKTEKEETDERQTEMFN